MAGDDIHVQMLVAEMKSQRSAMERQEARSDELHKKLDDIIARQLAYVEQISRLQALVCNGLTHNMEFVRAKLEKVCEEYGMDIKALKSDVAGLKASEWFLNWVSDASKITLKTLLKLAALGGLIFLIIHFGRSGIAELLKRLLA